MEWEITWLATSTSSIPWSTMISASLSLAQVTPIAPAERSMAAISGLLWHLLWGRQATPWSLQ